MTAPELPKDPGPGDEYDGSVEDIELSPQVRAEAEARIAAAVEKYGDAPIDD